LQLVQPQRHCVSDDDRFDGPGCGAAQGGEKLGLKQAGFPNEVFYFRNVLLVIKDRVIMGAPFLVMDMPLYCLVLVGGG